MKTEYNYKKIWTITYPVLISLLMQNLIGITDTAFLGRLGVVELGAAALGGIFYLVVYMVGYGFGVGAEILMARRNGEGHFKAIGGIFYHTLLGLFVMAGVIVLISWLLAPTILHSAISSEEVYEATMKYTSWRIFGLFFSFVVIVFRAFYMATTKTKILTQNSIVMVSCNVVLNYLLIFGKLGLPAMGIEGAAIASVLSEMVAALFLVLYSRYKTDYKRYGLFSRGRVMAKTFREVFAVSKWTMIQFFISCGTWLFFFLAIENLGERQLAVSNIVRNMANILYMFVSAFATTTTAMVSNLMGQGDQGKVMELCRRIIKICALCTIPFILIVALLPQLAMRIYTDDIALLQDSVPSLWVMLISYLPGIPAYAYFLAIAGTGNTQVTFRIEILSLVLYIVFIYIFVFLLKSDIAVCWTVETIYNSVLLILSYMYMKRGKWQNKVI